MTSTRARSLLIAGLTAGLLFASAPTSSAEVWSGRDPAGDSRPRIDVSALRVDNRARAIAMALRFHHPRRAHVGEVTAVIDVGTARGRGFLATGRWSERQHGFRAGLAVIEIESDAPPRDIDCPALRIDWQGVGSQRHLVVRVPRACMKHATDRIRVSAVVWNRRQSRMYDEVRGHFSPWIERTRD